MDYHNCKDLPLWAQILVNTSPDAKPERDAGIDLAEETAISDREVAA